MSLEAAACSLPVVAAPVGVNPEDDLVNVISNLLEDEGLCREIGSKLRKKVGKEYTWSRVAERVEEVYRGI